MKIGILTFHYSINQGSVIQAYCVYKLLKNQFPEATVEIINLIPANREENERNFVGPRPPFIKYRNYMKYKSIRGFIKNHTTLSQPNYSQTLEDQIDFINNQGYDYIFTGSDTVWMYSRKLNHLLPTVYFLPESIKAKKFAIAASVDPLLEEDAYLEHKDKLAKIFNNYEDICVRDNVSLELLKKIGVNKAKKIADPSLLHEFEDDLGLKKNKTGPIRKKNVMIWISDQKIADQIGWLLSQDSNFKLIGRKNNLSFFDNHVIDDINLYSKIDILITDRFHRSIFAMKLSKALVINIERYTKNPTPKSKGRDLLNDIGIPEYCVRVEKDNQGRFEKKILHLIDSWDQEKFEEREKLLQDFIEKNKKVWQSSVEKIIAPVTATS